MKPFYKYMAVSMVAGLVFSACEKETIETYNRGESKVYFQTQAYSSSNGAVGYSNSFQYSFANKSLELTEVVFQGRVQLLGDVVDYDRSVKVVVDVDSTSMTGEDYEINLDTLRIKAGCNYGEIGVRFLRNKSFREKKDTLVLRLEPNENFTVLERYRASNVWTDSNAELMDGSRYTFVISEIYTQPGSWFNVEPYFGKWSPTKFAYINNLLGFTDYEWEHYGTGKLSNARRTYFAITLQQDLQKRADEGEPLYDDDGAPMQLGDNFKVNYTTTPANK